MQFENINDLPPHLLCLVLIVLPSRVSRSIAVVPFRNLSFKLTKGVNMETIELLSIKLQNWISPNLKLSPRYVGYKKEVDGEMTRVEYNNPRYDIRIKFSTVELANRWAETFQMCLLELSGTHDYITLMNHDKPYYLISASNVDRRTGEIRNVITFTFVEPSMVINEEPELVTADAVPAGI